MIEPKTPLSEALLLRVGPLGGAIPQVQVPAALKDHIDPGLVESAGAQFEQQLGGVLPISARDLKAAGPDIPGEDGQGNAQRGLSELVLLIDLCALADQVRDDVVQPLIGGCVQRGPAVLPRGIHVGAVLHQELCRLDRRGSFLGLSFPLHVRAGSGRHHQRRRAPLGGDERIRPSGHQRLDHVKVVDFRGEEERRGALEDDFIDGDGGALPFDCDVAVLDFLGSLFLVLGETDIRIRAVLEKRFDNGQDVVFSRQIDSVI